MKSLEFTITLAAGFHSGQKYGNNQPYIFHPLQVMIKMDPEDTVGQIVAVLHDIVEDTDLTIESLRAMGYSEEIVDAIDAISRRSNESYNAYIARVMDNEIASRVKIEDSRANLLQSIHDLELSMPGSREEKKAEERISRYTKAIKTIEKGLTK